MLAPAAHYMAFMRMFTDTLPGIPAQQAVTNRKKVAFFDYPDVFEDFYPHYGVDQQTFATTWHNTGNHAWLKIIQAQIGDVTWYVLTLKPELKEARHAYVGCRIKFYSSSWLHRKCWKLFYASRNSWKYQKYYRLYATVASYTAPLSGTLLRALREDKPDVIFVQEYCSGRFDVLMCYAKLLGIPLVALHAGSTPDTYSGKWVRKFTLPRADYLFPSGIRERNRLANTYHIPAERLSITRPPINTTVYQPAPRERACRETGLNPERRYFIFIGRLDDTIKQVSSILDAFARVAAQYPDIDLLVIGSGPDEEKLKGHAAGKVSGRVIFTGWVAGDLEKARLLNTADCLVMASKREGFPTVIGEAFACGIPVISSEVGTISDLVIDGKTGWLFPPGDDEALTRCLLWVASNREQVQAMQPSIRQWAKETVSIEAIAKTLETGFLSVQSKSNGKN